MRTALRRFSRLLLLLVVVIAIMRLAVAVAPVDLRPPLDPDHLGTPGPLATRSAPTTLYVSVRAATGATIDFATQNGRSLNAVPPQAMNLPHLVLTRNGALTNRSERTVTFEVGGIHVLQGGVTLTLRVTTLHGDPDTSAGAPIQVWHEEAYLDEDHPRTPHGAAVTYTRTFTETVFRDARAPEQLPDSNGYSTGVVDESLRYADPAVATPTDTFIYELTATSAGGLFVIWGYAFLMDSQWIAPLPEAPGQPPGTAPDELAVYYCDMLPFRSSAIGRPARLPRAGISRYVGGEVVPAMVEAFRVQTSDWGFAWDPAWTSYRPVDGAARLSVALTDGQTWYHGQAPDRGHSGISINVGSPDNGAYDSLTDAIVSVFHHELLHQFQRGYNQAGGGRHEIDGAEGAWEVFSEGTAVLASSVGQSAVQFAGSQVQRDYIAGANAFLGSEWQESYAGMHPYHAAVYWRFLYEQCGGMRGGYEDPAAGMAVIQRVLAMLYSRQVLDIDRSTDVVRGLPRVLDRALARVAACPFRSYEESLIHFARAIYALRLDGGRCSEPGMPAGCGLYDPNGLYQEPPARALSYVGVEREVPGAIRSSFGIEFIEVTLHSAAEGLPMTLEFAGLEGSEAEFVVQVWQLLDRAPHARSRPVAPPVILGGSRGGRRLCHATAAIDTSEFNLLTVIISRVDPRERSDPVGAFSLALRPRADREQNCRAAGKA